MASQLVPASEYTTDDLLSTVRVIGPWWFCLTEHIQDPLGDSQLAALHSQQQRSLHELAGACELPAELFNIPLVEHELSLAVSLLRKRVDDERRAALEKCVDESMMLLHNAAVRVRSIRRPPTTKTGLVTGLFVSLGGVPKSAVSQFEVGMRGASGDRQKTRKHHGRAWQALCLWSEEVIHEFAKQGHSIAVGSAGENISISGLDWTEVLPGTQLQIGSVTCEVSLYTLPCSKNAQWFSDGDFDRMHHRRAVGVSRMYASVLEPGQICVGDTVTLS